MDKAYLLKIGDNVKLIFAGDVVAEGENIIPEEYGFTNYEVMEPAISDILEVVEMMDSMGIGLYDHLAFDLTQNEVIATDLCDFVFGAQKFIL